MKCPRDGAELVVSDRNGVEIDYCPECRGVWLDRGELDKILAQAQKVSEHEKWLAQVEQRREQAHGDRRKSETNPVSDFLAGFFPF